MRKDGQHVNSSKDILGSVYIEHAVGPNGSSNSDQMCQEEL